MMLVDYCATSQNTTIGPFDVDKWSTESRNLSPALYGLGELMCGESPLVEQTTITCPLIKPACQMKEFTPYDGCDLNFNWTDSQPACVDRRPCGIQAGYNG